MRSSTKSLAFVSTASAAEPGEGSNWTPETVNNGQGLSTSSTIGEARNQVGNTQNIVDVWRGGGSDNRVWISINHGNAFTIGTTTTFVAPSVVAWGPTRFMIFHTGQDNNIYYTWIDPTNATEAAQGWVAVPGQTTRDAVSVTQIGTNGYQLYMVYRSSDDDRVWGTSFQNFDGSFPAGFDWGNVVNIDGGLSPSAPSVTFMPGTDQLWAAVRGEDNQIYLNAAPADTFEWATWTAQGGSTNDAPAIAATNDGNADFVVSFRDQNSYINYGAFNAGGTWTGWSVDINNWQTFSPIFLSVFSSVIYAIATGINQQAYYKQVFKR